MAENRDRRPSRPAFWRFACALRFGRTTLMALGKIRNVCVYCGSAAGDDPAYARAAREMGIEIARRGMGLVYGGGSVGLMGIVADSALEAGGRVVGVIPRQFVREVVHTGLTELVRVDSMGERKRVMLEMGDAFIALPGGYGTFDEITEAIVLLQLGAMSSPCGFLDTLGFYRKFFDFLDHAERGGFISKIHRDMALVAGEPAGLLDMLEAYERPDEPLWWDEGLA